jgi:hypothetical protein
VVIVAAVLSKTLKKPPRGSDRTGTEPAVGDINNIEGNAKK